MELNDFRPTKSFTVIEGGVEIAFPLYNLDIHRYGLLYQQEILPEEIKQNIKSNLETVKDRVRLASEFSSEGIAVVGYGPTLQDTWQELRGFKTIITTSGAHKFLVDRDIIPTYHVDIDYRERKAVHLEHPHSDVTYLLGSMVHPKMVANIGSNRLKLWHLTLAGIEFPKEDVVLDGYWDVGQQAILVAQALGYRNQHLFGFDYSYDITTNQTHAGFHNGTPNMRVAAKVGDKYFMTSDAFARGVIVLVQLMEDNPELTLVFHSDGLLTAYLLHHCVESDSSATFRRKRRKGEEDTNSLPPHQ